MVKDDVIRSNFRWPCYACAWHLCVKEVCIKCKYHNQDVTQHLFSPILEIKQKPSLINFIFQDFRKTLQGKKTYIFVGLGLLSIVASYLSGESTMNQSLNAVFSLLGLGTLRAGIAAQGDKNQKKV